MKTTLKNLAFCRDITNLREDGRERAKKLYYRDDNKSITLDGKPARIVGWYNQVATIVKDGEIDGVDYSWATVANILERDNGIFNSK